MTTAQVHNPSVATAAAPGAAPSGRDTNGRFTVGNAGGPGNPFARLVAGLKKEFVTAAKERLPKILDRLFTLAEEGNVAAIKLVLQYTYGKATEPPNPDRLDADEWQRFQETAGMMAEMPELLGKPDPIVPLTLVRNVRPDVTRSFSGQMGVALADPDAFHAAEEKARETHFRQLERDSLHAAAKYDGFVPDETGLPPEVKPIQPKANGKNGGQGGRGKATPKANGKNGGRRPPRPESPVPGPAAPQNTGGGGRPPSPNRFIEGLPDWCPPIPVSDEPMADPGPPSPFGKNGK